MSRIHTNLRGDGDNYLLFHDTDNDCYVITLGNFRMYEEQTLRMALYKFKQLLYLVD